MRSAKTLLLFLSLAASFSAIAQTASRYDLVITEIMADPTPVVGLPNAEYIEIKNVSANAVSLNGWKLSDKTSTATLATNFVLQPDSIAVLCARSSVTVLSAFGTAIGVTSFPSLDNDGDLLTLRSPQNRTIHAVAYTADWYESKLKKEGGWSLEMIDPKNPCTGKENWRESNNPLGGTPGKTNSVNAVNADNTPPQLKRVYSVDSLTFVLVFDEPLDSATGAVLSNYNLPGTAIASATPVGPLFEMVQLKLQAPFPSNVVSTITVIKVTDCSGNEIGAYNMARLGLPQAALQSDVVINEILFNPKPGGSDYVEFYNRSTKIIDVSTLSLANRNSSGVVSSIKKLTNEPLYLFPGDYLVMTEDKASLEKQYLVKNPDAVLVLPSLPSLPDDKGTVVLQRVGGDIIDEVSYSKDWQFALIDDPEGVALERIDPNATSQNAADWHSAAATAGYGTPTYQNSQFKQAQSINAAVGILPRVFSPDNDGYDDIATITYQVEERGYVANVLVFDASGRLVRQLVKNDLLGLKGSWQWDGLNEQRQKLPIGTYIVLAEIFNLEGKKQSFKNSVVLARKLN